MPRTLVCFRRAAAGRACGEHQTIYEKALSGPRDGTVRPRRPTMKAMLPRGRSPRRRDCNVVRKNDPFDVGREHPAKVVANDAQTGLRGLELKNAAADAKSGDDVSAALKARRSK